ncbi:MAG: tetratricopeptide repeat protein [Arcicella sp.]|jgi:tetratricopeptide (TPR) repeat protein|nr:tetratricopeptide repeat protein [Arcicella sp.]
MKAKVFFYFIALSFGIIAQSKAQSVDITSVKDLIEAKKYDEARKSLKSIPDTHPDYVQAEYYLGKIAMGENKYDEAAEHFLITTNKNSHNADYFYWLGRAYGQLALNAGVLKRGITIPKVRDAFETAHTLAPKNQEVMAALIQFYLAVPEFLGGGSDRAFGMAKKLQAINKGDGHLALANIYMADENLDLAEKEYIYAAKSEVNNVRYILALGSFYQNQKKYTEALNVYEAFLMKHPENMSVTYQFGKCSALSGQKLEKGEELLNIYLKHKPLNNEPSLAGATMRLGMIYEKKGNKQEAKRLYETAIKSDPSLKEAKEALRRL